MADRLGKPRTIDTGPAGLLTPVGRLQFDMRAETQATAATGGAPSLIPAQERSIQGVLGAGNALLSAAEPFPLAEAAATPTTYEPVLPGLGPGLHRLEDYTLGNQGLIDSIAQQLDLLNQWATSAGVSDQVNTTFSSPQELAARLVSWVQRAFEPGGSRAPELRSFIDQSREGRRVFNFLEQLRANQMTWQGEGIAQPEEVGPAPADEAQAYLANAQAIQRDRIETRYAAQRERGGR